MKVKNTLMVEYEKIGIFTERPIVNYMIKSKSSDFIVEELFTEEDISGYEKPANLDILKKYLSENLIEKIENNNIERDKKELITTLKIDDKESRTILHKELKKFPHIITNYSQKEFQIFQSNEKGIFSFILRKENEDTIEAVQILSKKLKINFDDIKFAGNKDRTAITYQRISVNNVYIDDLKEFIGLRREREHLRLGRFLSNKFTIILRDNNKNNGMPLAEMVKNIELKKVPNFFGPQRFGRHADNHLIGEYIQNKQYEEAVNLIMKIKENDSEFVKEGKKYFHEGDYRTAYQKFPRNCMAEKTICKSIKKGYKETIFSIKKTLRIFFLHSYQSYIFNKQLSEMILQNKEYKEELYLIGSKIKRKTFFELENFEISEFDNNYKLSFILKPSSYATIALRELIGEPS